MATNEFEDLLGLDDLKAPELLPGMLYGDCIEVMRGMPENSVDSIVTDPPYGLGFMGKKWDALPPGEEWARECLRVLKPGGHLIAFGGSRTWHRLAVAIEDAGFEIRDGVLWLYGSGFPKSHDISKAIDKTLGVAREKVKVPYNAGSYHQGAGNWRPWMDQAARDGFRELDNHDPATPEAQQWQGWGTALKPAYEPAVMARKPFPGTVAANVLEHGTGAINIDASRIGTEGGTKSSEGSNPNRLNPVYGEGMGGLKSEPLGAGRFPANLILDEHTAELLDAQSGTSKSQNRVGKRTGKDSGVLGAFTGPDEVSMGHTDSGGASRFFYVAKAPKSERPVVDGVAHATVKPLKLMRYLVRMVTPPGGVVLDPFGGSGTTAEAAMLEGFQFKIIERESDYLPLIRARIERATKTLMEDLL